MKHFWSIISRRGYPKYVETQQNIYFPSRLILPKYSIWVAMEFVKDTEPKEIPISHLDTRKDRKDVVCVSYSYNGMKIRIVPVVTISWEPDHFVDGEWEKNTEKKP